MRRALMVLLVALFTTVGANATTTDYVHVRIVDVGAALCCLIELPDNHYMIYDAGYNEQATQEDQAAARAAILAQLPDIIPENSTIDLLVVSHHHADHMNAISDIFESGRGYQLGRLLENGYDRNGQDADWLEEFHTIQRSGDFQHLTLVDESGTVRLAEISHENNENEGEEGSEPELTVLEPPVGHGDFLPFCDELGVNLRILAGWPAPQWADATSGNPNETSVVLKLEFAGRSILFPGDSTGRVNHASVNQIRYAENCMVTNHETGDQRYSLDADVLVAGHHGSDGSTSTAFVQAVTPQYVIFASGHQYQHPSAATAERCCNNGVERINIFRTDWGDDETDYDDPNATCSEWDWGRHCQAYHDPPGDDNVDIWIYENGYLGVNYAY